MAEYIWSKLLAGDIEFIRPDVQADLEQSEILIPDREDELTSYCQLGCRYCGQEHTSRKMSIADQAKLVDRIESKLASQEYKVAPSHAADPVRARLKR